MPYVEPLSVDSAPADSQPILKAIQKKFGKSLNLFNSLAYQPQILDGVTKINAGMHNDLPAKLRELAYYKASQINECGYCSHYHRQAAQQAGVTDQQLAALESSASNDLFDDLEKAVLSFAEQLTKGAKVDAATVERLKKSLDDKQLVSLASAVALANFTNRINNGLDIELP